MIGWIGSILLAFCGAPQAIKTVREGHAKGLDPTFLCFWTFGEIFTFYAIYVQIHSVYLMFNYAANLVFLAIIWKYKLLPRKTL